MEGSSGVRKGAWTKEEDGLLRQCIEKYGEEKWHLVPILAGLNRCRKSCRLRWLNYLKPTIKRGKFEADEVDLFIRLHKLLGNRWTLIAGRLPGRTANDVKNYWNTHWRTCSKDEKAKSGKKTTEFVKAIKPRPRNLLRNKESLNCKTTTGNSDQHAEGPFKPSTSLNHHLDPHHDDGHNQLIWWEILAAASTSSSVGDFIRNL